MKKNLVIFLLLALIVTPVWSQGIAPHQRDPAFEQEIYERLERVNPEAVPIFQQATADSDANRLREAERGFERVLELAPDFPDALRRLSYVLIDLDQTATAVETMRHAYAVDPSPINRAALANALLALDYTPVKDEAFNHAKAAAQALPDDAFAYYIYMFAAAETNRVADMALASSRLIELSPENPIGHFFYGLALAENGQWEDADTALRLSQQLGMPAEEVERALNQGVTNNVIALRIGRIALYIGGAWLGGLALLFIAGVILSHITLITLKSQQPSQAVSQGERMLRRIYRTVITLTSAYYYLSIPFVVGAALVLALAAGLLIFQLMSSSKVMSPRAIAGGLALIVAMLFTVFAVVRSVFIRVNFTLPGKQINRDDAPALWALTETVAQQVGTRPIDQVYITPGVEFAVTEQGGIAEKMRDMGKRSLILGLGGLNGMTQGQFKAILAHEYGHFSNRDTAGGQLAMRVHQSIQQMALNLAERGLARLYNPAWLFLNGFYRVFLRITLGASRLQEILADRYAALAYGAPNFVDGLTHITRQQLVFDGQVNAEVNSAASERRHLHNLYLLPPINSAAQNQLEAEVQKIMTRSTSAYDSHPATAERIRLIEQLEIGERDSDPGDHEPALALFPDPERLQNAMTWMVQDRVHQLVAAIPRAQFSA